MLARYKLRVFHEIHRTSGGENSWKTACSRYLLVRRSNSGNGLRVKIQRVKLPKTYQKKAIFREDFEVIQKYYKIQYKWYLLSYEKSSEISSANNFFFREVFRSFYPFRFYPLALSDNCPIPGENGSTLPKLLLRQKFPSAILADMIAR